MSRKSNATAHSLALGGSLGHIGEYLLVTLSQLLLRLLCSLPLIYAALSGSFPGAAEAHATGVAILCCVPLWLLFVLPLRYRLGGNLSSWFGANGPDMPFIHYFKWLAQSLIRLLKALPFILPLLAWLGAYYYYIKMVDFPAFFLMIRSVGQIIGGDYIHGMALLILLFLICLSLAVWGWRRLMVFYYLPLAPVSRDSERLAALRGKGLGRVSLINFLIFLPALALLLYTSLFGQMSGELERDALTLLSRLTQFSLSAFNLGETGIWLAVLYLPFVLFRKAALAAAIHREGSAA